LLVPNSIDSSSPIDSTTKVWHYTVIHKNCQIGKHVTIGGHCNIGPNVKIGNHCKIQNNVDLYDGVEIEGGVFIGPNVTTTNVRKPRAFINRKEEFATTLIKTGATIGANATIVCGVEIGEYAFVAAGSVVTKNVENHTVVMGVPARPVAKVCYCGETITPFVFYNRDYFRCETENRCKPYENSV
jgi:UDP-2-acetamido-3-amino-2,3-dideoxy-glucuronate N-acetyltransferase